jgi:hypothetical protein
VTRARAPPPPLLPLPADAPPPVLRALCARLLERRADEELAARLLLPPVAELRALDVGGDAARRAAVAVAPPAPRLRAVPCGGVAPLRSGSARPVGAAGPRGEGAWLVREGERGGIRCAVDAAASAGAAAGGAPATSGAPEAGATGASASGAPASGIGGGAKASNGSTPTT